MISFGRKCPGSVELLEPVQINILLGRLKVLYTPDPLIHRGHIP